MIQQQSISGLAAIELCNLMDTKTDIIDCLNGLIDQNNTIIESMLFFLIASICVLGFLMWRDFR